MPAVIKPFLLVALGAWAVLAGHAPVEALAEELPREEAVRAVLVFNFLRFTEFPPGRVGNGREIMLCMHVRRPRQADALYQLDGRRVGQRSLKVVDFPLSQGACDVLYVDSQQRWHALADHPRLEKALTISAYPGFAREGGMIEVDVDSEGTRFDINLRQGRRVGFHFSPELLRLARRIHE